MDVLWSIVIVLGILLVGAGVVRHRMGPRGLEISGAQLVGRLGQPDCVVLDVRSDREFRSGRIPGALHIPHTKVAARLDELKPHKDKDIIVYCASGVRSRIAQNVLAKAGFARVYHLVGDMAAWRRENRTVDLAPAH